MAALASGQLGHLAGGLHGPMEEQCGRADPIRCCIVARLADCFNCKTTRHHGGSHKIETTNAGGLHKSGKASTR
eukprot:3629264-Pleurochrysis_carterae.AAC.2